MVATERVSNHEQLFHPDQAVFLESKTDPLKARILLGKTAPNIVGVVPDMDWEKRSLEKNDFQSLDSLSVRDRVGFWEKQLPNSTYEEQMQTWRLATANAVKNVQEVYDQEDKEKAAVFGYFVKSLGHLTNIKMHSDTFDEESAQKLYDRYFSGESTGREKGTELFLEDTLQVYDEIDKFGFMQDSPEEYEDLKRDITRKLAGMYGETFANLFSPVENTHVQIEEQLVSREPAEPTLSEVEADDAEEDFHALLERELAETQELDQAAWDALGLDEEDAVYGPFLKDEVSKTQTQPEKDMMAADVDDHVEDDNGQKSSASLPVRLFHAAADLVKEKLVDKEDEDEVVEQHPIHVEPQLAQDIQVFPPAPPPAGMPSQTAQKAAEPVHSAGVSEGQQSGSGETHATHVQEVKNQPPFIARDESVIEKLEEIITLAENDGKEVLSLKIARDFSDEASDEITNMLSELRKSLGLHYLEWVVKQDKRYKKQLVFNVKLSGLNRLEDIRQDTRQEYRHAAD